MWLILGNYLVSMLSFRSRILGSRQLLSNTKICTLLHQAASGFQEHSGAEATFSGALSLPGDYPAFLALKLPNMNS